MRAMGMTETDTVRVAKVGAEGTAKTGSVDTTKTGAAGVAGEVVISIAVSAAISGSSGISVNEHAE